MRKWRRRGSGTSVKFSTKFTYDEAQVLLSLADSVENLLQQRNADVVPDELSSITGIVTGNSRPPADATLRRLLPDFIHTGETVEDLSWLLSGLVDDHEDSSLIDDNKGADPAQENVTNENSALRSLHESEIIDAKTKALQIILDTVPAEGGEVVLDEPQCVLWLKALADIRLALGTNIGVGTFNDWPQEFFSDELAQHHIVYRWLSMVQELLTESVMKK